MKNEPRLFENDDAKTLMMVGWAKMTIVQTRVATKLATRSASICCLRRCVTDRSDREMRYEPYRLEKEDEIVLQNAERLEVQHGRKDGEYCNDRRLENSTNARRDLEERGDDDHDDNKTDGGEDIFRLQI